MDDRGKFSRSEELKCGASSAGDASLPGYFARMSATLREFSYTDRLSLDSEVGLCADVL